MGENPDLSWARMYFFPGGLRPFEWVEGATVSARTGRVNNVELNPARSWIMSVTFA